MGKTIFTLVLLIISLFAALKVKDFINNNAPLPTPTTSPSPTETISPTIAKVTLGLDEVFEINGTSLLMAAVTEDSRCPKDVQCIQAGKVVVSGLLTTPSGTSTMILEPGQMITTETLEITLDDVTPYPTAGVAILAHEYRFVLTINNK